MRQSISERAVALIRTPHDAALACLRRGPRTTRELAAALGINAGPLYPALCDLHRDGAIVRLGDRWIAGTAFRRASGGPILAVVGSAEAA